MEKDTNCSISDSKKASSNTSTTSSAHPFPSSFLIMALHPDHHHLSSLDGGDFAKNTTTSTSVLQPSAPGGGITTEFPFTEAQWKELERQAMIYKCMISSVPVPHHLLFPLPTDFPSAYGGGYGRKGDPEPGRCKRTDGKKWRCSREVAPLQKYCERHLHRGRPRSRKPVELKNNNSSKKTRLDQTKTEPLQKAKTDLTISTPPYHRDLAQPWEDLNLMGDYNSPSFDQDYSALNLFSYPEMELPTRFKLSECEGDLSPSLNLSMSSAAVAPLSWEQGGPLGEALQPASPYNSPTGVLHWTLFSNSDGSVCNSPTLAAEIPNHWHI